MGADFLDILGLNLADERVQNVLLREGGGIHDLVDIGDDAGALVYNLNYHQHGFALALNHEMAITVIGFHGPRDNDGFETYAGPLPFGILFTDSPDAVRGKVAGKLISSHSDKVLASRFDTFKLGVSDTGSPSPTVKPVPYGRRIWNYGKAGLRNCMRLILNRFPNSRRARHELESQTENASCPSASAIVPATGIAAASPLLTVEYNTSQGTIPYLNLMTASATAEE